MRGKGLKLLYRASRDGFEAARFHAKCDHQPRTLAVIRTTGGYIFGGYTEVTWDNSNTFKTDPSAFIFSLVNKYARPRLFPIKTGGKHSTRCFSSYGPAFGRGLCGNDIHIGDNSNASSISYPYLGGSFNFTLLNDEKLEVWSFLAGSYNFRTSDLSVELISI